MQILDVLKRWWAEASSLARAGVVFGILSVLGSTAYLLATYNQNHHIPLFSGMSRADASSLAQQLETRKIPYLLEDNGTTVSVALPQEEVYNLRNELSIEGYPRNGGQVFGLDSFKDLPMTVTTFERQVLYRSALQGELARTISQLPQIESARVHLALPNKSILEREGGEPKASVYISLKPGHSLSEKVATGIAHLVASSVEGLSVERIAILDGNGTMLHRPDDGSGSGQRFFEIKQSQERALERDISDLIERTVGDGHVIAKVTIDMEMSQLQETQEQYDADNTALRSRRDTQEETSNKRTEATAGAGVQGNLPQDDANNQQTEPRGSQSNSTKQIKPKNMLFLK